MNDAFEWCKYEIAECCTEIAEIRMSEVIGSMY
jgi:hypothetical protein